MQKTAPCRFRSASDDTAFRRRRKSMETPSSYEQLWPHRWPRDGDNVYHIAVVDPSPTDYAQVAAKVGGASWEFLASASEALRVARTRRVDLWIVNLALPDMPGLDLCRMLRERRAAGIFAVANQYSTEAEQAARVCGVSVFLCKPADCQWFDPRLSAVTRN
jgi:DNA-binding response OmpR family regulator